MPPAPDTIPRFETAILPHLDGAYNLARWLCGNETDAHDVVQEAALRAFRAFDGFHGVDGRSWFLTIVRHTAYTWLRRNRPLQLMSPFDEMAHNDGAAATATAASVDHDPAARLLQGEDEARMRQALERLPVEFREALLLRHQEGLSYKQIAAVTEVALGTVMSRLARARTRLRYILAEMAGSEESRS